MWRKSLIILPKYHNILFTLLTLEIFISRLSNGFGPGFSKKSSTLLLTSDMISPILISTDLASSISVFISVVLLSVFSWSFTSRSDSTTFGVLVFSLFSWLSAVFFLFSWLSVFVFSLFSWFSVFSLLSWLSVVAGFSLFSSIFASLFSITFTYWF